MSYTPDQNHAISYATAVALLIHGLVLFWIAFNVISNAAAPSSSMEVTLSNSNSETKPEEADFISENNQIGSGEIDEAKELTTQYESIFPDSKINDVKPIIIPELQQSEEAVITPRIITTTGASLRLVVVQDSPEDAAHREEQGNSADKNRAELSLEIASSEARLSDQQQRFTKNPRVLVISSASTLAAENARYVHQGHNRVEDVGNLHYPKESREKGLYGDVRLLVKLKSNGTVEETTIMSSSGSEVLDRAAMQSIRLASPFEPFPKQLAEKYDRIDVIRTWQFRKDKVTAKAG